MHGDRFVRYGLAVGSSDLIGILSPHGRMVAIEVKTSTGRLTTTQKKFLESVRASGGIAGVARSPQEALDIIEGRYEQGLEERIVEGSSRVRAEGLEGQSDHEPRRARRAVRYDF
jgi:hypothetical protein